jgi:glycosyltransferase involved in cell wall biosynthesis
MRTRVFLDVLPWDIRPRNTDWRYVRYTLPQLARHHTDLEFTIQQSRSITLLGAAKTLHMAAARRLGHPVSTWRAETSRLAANELAASGCDVVYSHREYPLNAGGKPVLWMSAILDPAMCAHYGVVPRAMRADVQVKSDLFHRAAAVQVSTEAEAKRHAAMFPDIAGRFIPVPFYTPHIEACPRAALDRHLDALPVRLLFVGNNAVRKGLPELLQAFMLLPERLRKRSSLTIVSNFDRGKVSLPASDRIRVIRGASPMVVAEEMRRAHVLVNAAHFESYGFVFVEAMAQGLACVAPPWEVQRELFDGGRAGVLTPCDVHAVGEAIERLIEDDLYRLHLALAGWQRFQERYAPEVVGRRYAEMFRAVASGR